MERNEHITDLVTAIEARLTSLCPLLAAVSRSQATSYEQLAGLTTKLHLLPAGVVVLGPVETEDELSTQASRWRAIHLGVLVVGEFDASEDAGTASFWAALDQVHDAFIPTVLRGESAGLPVAVCGAQSGEGRGTLLIPAGYEPVEGGKGRCAGVYRLLCLDTVAERTGLPTDPADPAPPDTGVASLADLDRLTLWISPTWQRRFVTGATIKAQLKGDPGEPGAAGAQGPAGDPGGPAGPQGIQGPEGPTGLTGPTGPTGLTGLTGPAGADGAAGATGAQGPSGPQGPQGIQGPAGTDGVTGAQGPSGPQGPAGADGVAGAAGAQGPSGPQGPAGADGAAGAQGPSGPQGLQGIQGPDGPTGPTGLTGLTGPQGPAGADGAAGAQGPSGPQGPDGAEGADGAAGAQGPSGPQGPAGAAGADGAAGAQGPSGPQGPAGAAGADGAAGAQGPSGPQGPAGADGADGAAGAQGPSGPQGPAGADGADGAAGAQGPSGPQGPAGAAGATGAQGPSGPQGPAGSNGTNGTNGTNGEHAVAFADATARGAATPAFIGQLGLQLDTSVLYKGTATTAGSWTAAAASMVDAVSAGTLHANSVLYATADHTPAQLLLAASTFAARASTGDIAAKTVTDAALTVLDDATVAAMRATLGAAPLAAVKHVFWPIGAFKPAATAGAAIGTIETATNKVNADLLDFDSGATAEIAWCWGGLDGWDGGTIKCKVQYMFTTIASGDDVEFEIGGRAYGDNEDLDQAIGTTQVITDVAAATGKVYTTGATPAITLAGTPALGEMIGLKVMRNTDGTDDAAGDCRILGVWLEYTKAATEEAAW